MYDVSVLIATHNGAHTLGRALRSIFYGTRCKVEVCICDDDSTDETLFTIRDSVPDENKNIRITRHTKNKGTAQALNSAANIAQGRYFIILGDDDHFQRGALDVLFNALDARADVGFTYGCTHYYGVHDRIHIPPAFNAADFWKSFSSLYAVLYRREAFDSGIRYRDLITLENGRGLGVCDYDFVLQMIHAGYTGLALPDALILNYLYMPAKRQSQTVLDHMPEMIARFKETWPQWEGNSL